ncbi:MAG: hypothetical protein Rubg2KO_16770 [Rubricoccaceae bacterium]
MRVVELPPVEPLTASKVSRQTGVPLEAVRRMIDLQQIPLIYSGSAAYVVSSDLHLVRAVYARQQAQAKYNAGRPKAA